MPQEDEFLEERVPEFRRLNIEDLEKGGVNWAILQDEKGEGDLSFLARAHPESRRLDDFFITRFFEVERFGRFSVVKRR